MKKGQSRKKVIRISRKTAKNGKKRKRARLGTIWEVPDSLWEIVYPILLRKFPTKAKGRKREDWRKILNGIIYIMRTGAQWGVLPRKFGSKSTVHRWFQVWVETGTLGEIWGALVGYCDELGGVFWEWQSVDGALGKARMGGDKIGPNPTDRAKNGTKKSILVDEYGGPLSAVVAAANVNDSKLLRETIESIIVERPNPEIVEQNLCLDKGYNDQNSEEIVEDFDYIGHIKGRSEDRPSTGKKSGPRSAG